MTKFFGLITLLFILGCNKSPEEVYDQKTGQKPVMTHKKLDEVLSGLRRVSYDDLPESYKKFAQFEAHPEIDYHSEQFYLIHPDSIYQFLVGKCRVYKLVPNDKLRKGSVSGKYQNDLIFLIKPEVVHKLLDLILLLKEKGYDPFAMELISGFRHPRHNDKIKGHRQSQHMMGNAIDIRIGDIDKNGKIEKKDKWIVYDILDKELIKDQGGIGRYPQHMALHFDLRGYHERWDDFVR